jgi:hypothetical protein
LSEVERFSTKYLAEAIETEKAFSVVLFGLRQILEEKPEFLHEELKMEFYR